MKIDHRHPADQLLELGGELHRLLLAHRDKLPEDAVEHLTDAIVAIDGEMRALNDEHLKQPTVDSLVAPSIVARGIAALWMNRPLQYKGKYRTVSSPRRNEDEVRDMQSSLGDNPDFRRGAEVLAKFVLPPGTKIDAAEWWSTVWSGPELAAIDADETTRAAFWREFVAECKKIWKANYVQTRAKQAAKV